MRYWDSIQQMQRLLDSFEPIRDQLRQMQTLQRSIDQFRMPIQALELERQFRAFQAAMPAFRPFLKTTQILADAIRPLPDFSRALPSAALGSAFDAINVAIRSARFIAELDLSDDEDIRPDRDDLVERIEQELIEIVPAEALEELRRVEFAPFTLLDRVLRDPFVMHSLSARGFEGFIAALVERLGFEDVVLTPRSGDRGRDVLATKRIHGISILCAFECKRYAVDRPVGPDAARALLGVIMHGETRATKGILVTTSHFTPAASRFVLTEPSLDGQDFDGIVDWLRRSADSEEAEHRRAAAEAKAPVLVTKPSGGPRQ